MWYELIFSSWIAYNYGVKFQSFRGVDFKLNNQDNLITNLIIVAIIVCIQMISG